MYSSELRGTFFLIEDCPQEERAAEQEDYSDLYQAVSRLPEGMRICVTLYYMEGYSVKEIASLRGGELCDKLLSGGIKDSGIMQYYDVKSSGDNNGSNYIDALQPGETVTVNMGFLVNEDELGYLYLDLSGAGAAYEFTERSLETGYVDIRQQAGN